MCASEISRGVTLEIVDLSTTRRCRCAGNGFIDDRRERGNEFQTRFVALVHAAACFDLLIYPDGNEVALHGSVI